MGVTVQQAVEGLVKAGADIVGSNCGNGIKNMLKIAEEFIKYSPLPVSIRSNAGLPELKDGTAYFPETPKFMSEWSMELKKMGVKIIGGCCGTTPEHIAAIKKRVEN
jgi:5-methyltetrahydrofolate--homocysteine methyltransferase